MDNYDQFVHAALEAEDDEYKNITNEYIKTLNVGGYRINLSLDDYGQCYFIEWVDKDGKKKSTGLGAYNTHYMEDIYYMFDERYKELSRKEMFGQISTSEWLELEKYEKLFEEEYKR